MAAANLTPAEVTEQCTAGYDGRNRLGARGKEVKFEWCGRNYVAKHTGFRLCVDNAAGEPKACRYD